MSGLRPGSLGITAIWILVLVNMLAGCAEPSPPPQPLPAGIVGRSIELLHLSTRAIRAAVDANGVGHVIAVGEDDQLYHAAISLPGVVTIEVLGQVKEGGRLGLVADVGGGLRILAGSRYLSGTTGHWVTRSADRCESVVASGHEIVCVFRISGREAGSPLELGLLVLPGGLPIPLIGHPDKLVLAREESNGWRPFAIVEPDSRSSVSLTGLAADRNGSLHMSYDQLGAFIIPGAECRYAEVSAPKQPVTIVTPVIGKACVRDSFIVSAAGKRVLFVWPKADRAVFKEPNDTYRVVPGPPSPSCLNFEAVDDGGGGFHAVSACRDNFWTWTSTAGSAVYYTRYTDASWSSPFQLAAVGELAFGAANWPPERGFRIASGANGRALAVMALRGSRLVARWIETGRATGPS